MVTSVDIGTHDNAFRSMLQKAVGLTTTPDTTVHENDQMLSFAASARGSEAIARSDYFTSGAYLLNVLEQFVNWKFGSLENVSSFLDFASGYGRLTRFLAQKLPPDRIWVSDIQADAVAFQQAQFGVHGFVSATNPDDLSCDLTFDCILVVSLFTHLPPSTFTPWLRKLYSLLKPGGLLIFSVHDESRMLVDNAMPDSGIWFEQTSEVVSLDVKDYGVSFVTEAFVHNAILAATGRTAYHRIPRGLLFHQDIYLVTNDQSPDYSGLQFAYLPHGAIDFALWTGSGEFRLRGWAADITGSGTPIEVHIFVDNQLQQKCVPSLYRPDVRAYYDDDRFLNAGWECSFPLPSNDPAQFILVKCISTTGAEIALVSRHYRLSTTGGQNRPVPLG